MAVLPAVREFLDGRDLDGHGRVLAEVALVLAEQLDAACAQDTARALSAVPPLSRRLAETLRELDDHVDSASAEDQARRLLAPLRGVA